MQINNARVAHRIARPGSVNGEQLATTFFQLSHLLDAGISLVQALNDLLDDEKRFNTAKRTYQWRDIIRKINAGQSFSQALETSAIGLDAVSLSLIKAGEISGQLDKACASAHSYLQWHHALHRRMATVLLYPMFSALVLLAVVTFLFVSVVPSIEGFLLSSEAELAWHTNLLMDFSKWISLYYLEIVISCFALVVMVHAGKRISTNFQGLISAFWLQVPLVGSMIIELSLSRYTRCTAQLYRSGVALESALQISEQTVSNQQLRNQLIQARQRMVSGASLTDALRAQAVFPLVFVRMIGVGESSGQLASVLFTLAERQQQHVEQTLARVEQIIGPMVMMLVGIVLLWIVVSALGPVYDLAIATATGLS